MQINTKRISIALGSLLVVVSIYYYWVHSKALENEQKLIKDKKEILICLKKTKDSLNLFIANDSLLRNELLIQREQINQLIKEVKSQKTDCKSLHIYKTKIAELQKTIKRIVHKKAEEVRKKNALTLNNQLLLAKQDSIISALEKAKQENESLQNINHQLNATIKKASKTTVVNLKAITLRKSKKGVREITDKGRKATILSVEFTVIVNPLAKPQDKQYYVQILDTQNNVLEKPQMVEINNRPLYYSFIAYAKLENENFEVSKDISINKLPKGNYLVNIYDKSELVAKTNFIIR